eukprot:TRINITY_DN11938_c6_g2_i1.p1 TRINITY_DN11938_c6_g2~~TRINITY_DN11938_c6_g2_i1.p1  ORF type:complete len:143 (+),score=14.81 TRINITY_DN11938_c6_g2_i1:108-536(+)
MAAVAGPEVLYLVRVAAGATIGGPAGVLVAVLATGYSIYLLSESQVQNDDQCGKDQSDTIEGKDGETLKPEDFTEREKGASQKGEHDSERPIYRPEGAKGKGPYIQGDRAGDRAHGARHKVFDKNGNRIGDMTADGRIIRRR